MIRTFKFRGKRIDNGEWVYGLLPFHNVIREFSNENSHNECLNNNCDYKDYTVDTSTVDQMIDIDVEMKGELYENDIIEVCFGYVEYRKYVVQRTCDCWGEPLCDTAYVGCIYDHTASISLEDLIDDDGYAMFNVIGNLHENRELLTENMA